MKSQLVKALRNIEGLDVFDDEMSLEIYSQDASIFHIRPLAVAWPRSCDDLEKIVNLCKIEGVAIIARGAATSVTGAPLGSGLCLDFTRHMNRLISIDPLTQSAWVEPGLVQDRLNEAASLYNLRLGPDTSTGNRATIGGMIGNNSAGAHSLTYGMMSKHLEAVEVVLSSGRRVLLEKEHDRQKALADPDLCPIVHWQEKWHKRQSELSFAKVSRNSHGYLIQELLQAADSKTLNMAGAFCASEGTLGLISKAKLRLCPKAQQTSLWLLGYNSLEEAFEDAPKLAKLKPYACELIDEHILEASRKSPDPAMRHIKWIHGSEKAFIGFEVQQDSAIASSTIDEQKLSLFSSKAISRRQLLSSPEQQEFWAVRKSGVGLLMSRKSADKAIAFIEDLTLPLESISLFLKGLRHLLSEEKKEAGIYGHIVAGCFHIRPYIDLRDEDDENKLWDISKKCAGLVKELGGSLTGGHGDGLARSWLNADFFQGPLYEAFVEFKNAFDPRQLFNPGKIVLASQPKELLRQSPRQAEGIIPTFLDFEQEGGFHEAARRCNGNGNCRKAEGVMCPSFQVTQDEKHSTRGRAVALQGLIEGRLDPKYWSSKELKEVMDLCLECKGCVKECPSSVDMSKLKSEMLYHYHKEHKMRLRDKLMSHIGPLSHLGSYLPRFLKETPHRELTLRFFDAIGFAKERPLPLLATKPLRNLWKNRYTLKESTVWLYADTYASFYEPVIGIDALKILELAGHRPYLLPYRCCGRPAFSKGDLDLAQTQASKSLNLLQPHDKETRPIVILEPSCRSLFSHDLISLIPTPRAKLLQSRVHSLEALLIESGVEKLKKLKIEKTTPLHVHMHCHERSLEGEETLLNLAKLLEIKLKMLPSGCCGMAGSFGFEQEHYEISKAIAEQKIAPAMRPLDSEAIIISSGTSCRTQWQHVCARETLSTASALLKLFKF